MSSASYLNYAQVFRSSDVVLSADIALLSGCGRLGAIAVNATALRRHELLRKAAKREPMRQENSCRWQCQVY